MSDIVKVGYLNVRVDCVFPPIPLRQFDYSACRDGHEEEGPYGHGETQQAAIDELIEKLNEEAEAVQCQKCFRMFYAEECNNWTCPCGGSLLEISIEKFQHHLNDLNEDALEER